MTLVMTVGDSKLRILGLETLRRNVGKDKIVRTKALKSQLALGTLKQTMIKTDHILRFTFFNTSYIIQQVIL